MTDTLVPPEGQLSFSGIPAAEFIEDVDTHMAAEESAESHLKVIIILNSVAMRLCQFYITGPAAGLKLVFPKIMHFFVSRF